MPQEHTRRELNKLVLRADTEKNEWTFSGEIWKAIENLLSSHTQALREKVEKMKKEKHCIDYDCPRCECDSEYNQALQDVLTLLEEEMK